MDTEIAELAYRKLQAERDQWKNGYETLSRLVAQYLQAIDEYDHLASEPEKVAKLWRIDFQRAKLEAHIHKGRPENER